MNAQRRVAYYRSNAWLRGDNLSSFIGRRILVTGTHLSHAATQENKAAAAPSKTLFLKPSDDNSTSRGLPNNPVMAALSTSGQRKEK